MGCADGGDVGTGGGEGWDECRGVESVVRDAGVVDADAAVAGGEE